MRSPDCRRQLTRLTRTAVNTNTLACTLGAVLTGFHCTKKTRSSGKSVCSIQLVEFRDCKTLVFCTSGFFSRGGGGGWTLIQISTSEGIPTNRILISSNEVTVTHKGVTHSNSQYSNSQGRINRFTNQCKFKFHGVTAVTLTSSTFTSNLLG